MAAPPPPPSAAPNQPPPPETKVNKWLVSREEIEKPVRPGGASARTATKLRHDLSKFIRVLGSEKYVNMYPRKRLARTAPVSCCRILLLLDLLTLRSRFSLFRLSNNSPQLAIATATLYMHRFFLRKDFLDHDRHVRDITISLVPRLDLRHHTQASLYIYNKKGIP